MTLSYKMRSVSDRADRMLESAYAASGVGNRSCRTGRPDYWPQAMHQPTLIKWADLLGPLFPSGAKIQLQAQLNLISVSWSAQDGDGGPAPRDRTVAIFIAPNALKDYRNAQDGQQARADRKLFSLVHSNLKRHRPEDEVPAGMPELRIVVASVDILSCR